MTLAPVVDLFWAKVDKNGPVLDEALGPCWVWTAAKDSRGYGRFGSRRDPGSPLAHRRSFIYVRGPIPSELPLDHLCRNTSCVNPFHLEPVTTEVNNYRIVPWQAWNAKKRICPSGHSYEGENLRIDGKGHRHCRTCDAACRALRSHLRSERRVERFGFDPGPLKRMGVHALVALAEQPAA